MFNKYLAQLNDLAQNHTHENFVQIQKVQADILTAYTKGSLSDIEKRHLYGISTIIMDEMRKELSK